jgi:hypothetical protein
MTNGSEDKFKSLEDKNTNNLFENNDSNSNIDNDSNIASTNNSNNNDTLKITKKSSNEKKTKQKLIYIDEDIIKKIKQLKNRTGHSESYLYERILRYGLRNLEIE